MKLIETIKDLYYIFESCYLCFYVSMSIIYGYKMW